MSSVKTHVIREAASWTMVPPSGPPYPVLAFRNESFVKVFRLTLVHFSLTWEPPISQKVRAGPFFK
jgi:hypothetical protein